MLQHASEWRQCIVAASCCSQAASSRDEQPSQQQHARMPGCSKALLFNSHSQLLPLPRFPRTLAPPSCSSTAAHTVATTTGRRRVCLAHGCVLSSQLLCCRGCPCPCRLSDSSCWLRLHSLGMPRKYLLPRKHFCAVILLQSEACDECRGLPEEMSHVLQALRRNYAGEQGVWQVLSSS